MHRCKREAVDLEKMQRLEEKLEEEEEMLKKKKKSREMEEGPGTPQQVVATGTLDWCRRCRSGQDVSGAGVGYCVTFSSAAQDYKSGLFKKLFDDLCSLEEICWQLQLLVIIW